MTAEQNYLQDVLSMIIEAAKEAKLSATTGKDSRTVQQQAFEEGRALAYYEVVSTLLNQAEVFGLSPDILRVLNFNPDEELL